MQALGAPPPEMHGSGDYDYQQDYQRSYAPQEPYEYAQHSGPGGGSGGSGRFSDRSRLVDWTLKGLGLLGVALVSGFLWYLIRNNPGTNNAPQTTPPAQTQGLYSFQAFAGPATDTNCASEATDRVQSYLQSHACVTMTRSLYTASLSDGEKVITSIAVVRMHTVAQARELKSISDANGTGHVKDLVEDGTVVPNGPTKSLQAGAYVSEVKGARFIVVMTEYIDTTQDTTANINANATSLRGVGQDAIKQGLGGTA